MLRAPLIIVCFCLGILGYSQEIIWGSKQLVWDDFTGEVDPSSKYKALTYSQITSWYTFDQDTLSFNITAEFVSKKSWKTNEANDRLLQHEQIHFDITEYVARLYRKALQQLKFDSYLDIKPKIAELFKEYSERRKKIQKDYDKETDHSKIVPRQEKWNQKVAELLELEAEFAQPKFSIYIGYMKDRDHNKPR